MFRAEAGQPARAGVRLRLEARDDDGAAVATWDLVAPARCELLDGAGRQRLLDRLGPDPLRGDGPATAFARIQASGRTIGELLLDQSVVAGAGNVLRAEVLHLCRLHPSRPGRSLEPAELDCLWSTLARLLARAVEEGRILTVDTPEGVDRTSLPEADARYVYRQDRCRTCGHEVRTWPLGNRTAYACERCQPRRVDRRRASCRSGWCRPCRPCRRGRSLRPSRSSRPRPRTPRRACRRQRPPALRRRRRGRRCPVRAGRRARLRPCP